MPAVAGSAAPARAAHAQAQAAVRFDDVSRDYVTGWLPPRKLRAIDRVSFAVQPGECFGLLGPNRAGKTTLVKMLLSLSRPTSGGITRLGKPVADRSTLARVGYVHENHAFPRYLDARGLLRLYAAVSLVPAEKIPARVEELLDLVGLADRASDPVEQYSKGMVQRLGMAQALLPEPDLLVLDEPTEGLDLGGRRLLRSVVQKQTKRGGTVVLVTHVLAEVEALCDRVAVLKAGRLAHLGTLRDLTARGRSLEQALTEIYDK